MRNAFLTPDDECTSCLLMLSLSIGERGPAGHAAFREWASRESTTARIPAFCGNTRGLAERNWTGMRRYVNEIYRRIID